MFCAFLGLFVLLALRMPVAIAMAVVGTVGFGILNSWPAAMAARPVPGASFCSGAAHCRGVPLEAPLRTLAGAGCGLGGPGNRRFGPGPPRPPRPAPDFPPPEQRE